MLKKINRGLSSKEIRNILERGKIIQTYLFGVRYKYLPLTGQVEQHSRYAWVISKKISKRAIDRNKIRRRLAEVMARKMIGHVEMVILVKREILNSPIDDISKCWNMVHEKIGA